MFSKKYHALSFTLLLSSAPLMAADNPGSHQHGHAEMQLAFADNQVEILLTSPAGNMLGFEHHPRTPEQHQTEERVTHWLGENPLVNTPESTCQIQATTVQHEVAGGHDHGGHSHGDESQHADITVTQILNCTGLDNSTSLTTPLIAHFPALEHLDIAWAGPDGQGAARLGQGESSFRVGR
ncbi:ZrgA family zinc uptake protein [Marinobacter sp. KMM 10035]|uniref:ZrgA family zinc uptake protein n=1 Tax=Marinobacter sp. KMM 10035 TaxID=3134034 RepID=UPI00397AAAB8